jgi:hypothetical protein
MVPVATLRLKDDEPIDAMVAQDVLATIAFLTDIPLNLSNRSHEDEWIPESDEDIAILEGFGTNLVYHQTRAIPASRTFGDVKLTGIEVGALQERTVGLRIYADAIKIDVAVGRFRELWRVLESAFKSKDDELVDKLAAYPPSLALKFDRSELKDLLVLRGRASHAANNKGLKELAEVNKECGNRVGRLKNLVERVIVTKASWGYPTLAVKELIPLQAFIGPSGEFVIFQQAQK